MELTKEKIMADKMSELTENDCNDSNQSSENNSDVLKLKAQEAELMSMISDPKIMKAYRAIRRDVYGVSERRQVSQKEKKKKKAKRRMAKKSKR